MSSKVSRKRAAAHDSDENESSQKKTKPSFTSSGAALKDAEGNDYWEVRNVAYQWYGHVD